MSRTVLENCRIVDAISDKAIEGGVLAFSSKGIAFVGPAAGFTQEPDDEVINLMGYTVMPGLFNCHCHLDLQFGNKQPGADDMGTPAYRTMVSHRRAMEAMEAGVTSLRITGSADGSDFALKKAYHNGMLWGPNIITAGCPLIPHGGHGSSGWGSRLCSGVDDFIKGAREQFSMGADFIKMIPTGGMSGAFENPLDQQMTDEEIKAVITMVHNNNKKLTAHLGGDRVIRMCVEMGIDSIEHAYTMSYETAQRMAAKGTFLVPTLTVSYGFDYMKEMGSPQYLLDKLVRGMEVHTEAIQFAIKAGVKLCSGTDMLPADPHSGTTATVRELELYVQLGLSPMEALLAGTRNPAEMCGIIGRTGTLEIGKDADILAVRGKPDQNISDLRNIDLVVKGGGVVRSDVPGYSIRNLGVTYPGVEIAGGVYKRW